MRKPATKASVIPFPPAVNGDGPQPPENTPNKPGARIGGMLDVTREKIVYLWLNGKSELRIAEEYGIRRADVEIVVKSAVGQRLRRVA